MTRTITQASASRKLRYSMKSRRAVSGYLFILPFIVGFLAFMVYPLIDSLYMSFCEVKLSPQGRTSVFIGLYNYVRALTIDPEFNRMLTEEFQRMVTQSLAILVVSFIIALLLNQKFKGRTFARAIFFLPVILASGVLVGIETDNTLLAGMKDLIANSNNFSMTEGMRTILMLTGIGGGVLDVVFTLIQELYDIVIASGIQIIVFLSGLQTIGRSLYEAADVEGATKWESFWMITFPMISSLLLVNVIYTIIDFFMKTDNEVMEKIQEEMVINLNYGFSSAMSWIYFILTIALIGVCTFIISKGVHSYE
ncbi:MAG: sugar ABC transporter permease [Oscillospiraceae bacterium]|nr:sugar ABC transporter permease [Oscillospiraceae bacterium]